MPHYLENPPTRLLKALAANENTYVHIARVFWTYSTPLFIFQPSNPIPGRVRTSWIPLIWILLCEVHEEEIIMVSRPFFHAFTYPQIPQPKHHMESTPDRQGYLDSAHYSHQPHVLPEPTAALIAIAKQIDVTCTLWFIGEIQAEACIGSLTGAITSYDYSYPMYTHNFHYPSTFEQLQTCYFAKSKALLPAKP